MVTIVHIIPDIHHHFSIVNMHRCSEVEPHRATSVAFDSLILKTATVLTLPIRYFTVLTFLITSGSFEFRFCSNQGAPLKQL